MEAISRSIKGVDEVFRRLAFGYSGGKTADSSVAVAVGLILNYFDRTVDSRVIPGVLKTELLVGSQWDKERYVQANRLHGYLMRYCHLSPKSFGLWGMKVVKRFRQYWQQKPWVLGVIVRCGFGGKGEERAWNLIAREIDNSRPVMVTFKTVMISGKRYKNHTAVVCGYHVSALGRRELLIHPGLYGEKRIKGSRVLLVSVPVKKIRCSYRFEVMLLSSAVQDAL